MRLLALLALSLLLVAGGCGGEQEETGSDTAPRSAEPAGSRAVVRTSHGTFTIGLARDAAPGTTGSFIRLARKHFFDGTTFHRIVPGFVIQGGDPTGTGTGGPGYSVTEPPPADTRYTKGVVAMAKGGDEPPGTSGSQFFVVTGPDTSLPPEYAVLGKVTAGLDVVERIGALGDPTTERPTERVRVRSITIR
ncbi:MAG: peptidylprolyl isomerase [Actinobacteria bacterium]|nr:peptidylprolyl isomerase [Actinomycetota bacterium]